MLAWRLLKLAVWCGAIAAPSVAQQCTFQITSNLMGAAPAAGGDFVITVSASNSSCARTATSNNPDFITISFGSPGTGSGTVGFTVAVNKTTTPRTGSITVAGVNYNLTQAAGCGFTLNPFTYQADPSGATSTFQVQPSVSTCLWTAASNDPDIVAITAGGSGTGTGTVTFKVSANPAQSSRSGTIVVGGSTGSGSVFTIYQPGGAPCSFVLSGSTVTFPSSGGPGSFAVTTTCAWTPSTPVDWISLNSQATVTGNGVAGFLVAPNVSSVARASFISVGSQSFAVTQAGVVCNVTADQAALAVPAAGLQGILNVSAADGCNWTAVSGAPWITLQTGTGSGQGTVAYTIAANTSSLARSANITIANRAIKVTQDGADCSGQVLTPSHAELPASAGTFSFNVGTACSYTAVANSGWIRIVAGGSGTGSGDVTYTVAANASADGRNGSISVGPQVFTIAQSGASCSLSLSPTSASVPGQGGAGSFNVTATASCHWQPSADAGWIHTSYASANGSGRVNYTADRSEAALPRTGSISINGQIFRLTQGARPAIQVTAAGVVNGASLAGGPVAAGEIVTIFGDQLGPETGVTAQLTPDRQAITNTLGGTSILFDGTAAPLIYVSRTQVSAIVPYGVDANPSTQMQVVYQDFRSDPVTLDVARTAPGLFTIDATGAGQGAILNQNGTANSRANPAAKNSVISLFATGEGQTNPSGVDGKLAQVPLPRPILAVTVQIGGRDAVVLYAGGAPGLPAGVLQVNARIPAQTPSGAVPVTIAVGNANSGTKTTVAVQ